jgi:hypothetical protein
MVIGQTGGDMNTGIIEKILYRRYGQPTPSIENPFIKFTWNTDNPDDECILYMHMKSRQKGRPHPSIKEIYGDAIGGFLIGDSLKIASLSTEKIWGLPHIDKLRTLQVIEHSAVMDPQVDYFMDAANVWYYGVKRGDLYVFDTTFDELDSLGPIEAALETLMDEWESSRQRVRNRS